MAWHIKGELVESCSCNMFCPCWYGVKELMIMDQGWCGSPWLVRIADGNSNGVDLSGLSVVLAMFFPGPTLLDGNGTGRVIIDERATEEQRKELASIFTGEQGGPLEIPASLMSSWLPTQYAAIDISAADGGIDATIGDYGTIISRSLVNEAGDKISVKNAGFAVALQFGDNRADLAPSDGSEWRDPEMPEVWSGRSGAIGQIAWNVA